MSDRHACAADPNIMRLRLGYFSPAWRYTVEEAFTAVRWTLIAGLWIAYVPTLWVLSKTILTPLEATTLLGAGFHSLHYASYRLGLWFAHYRGGYGLKPDGSDFLHAKFERGHFSIRFDTEWRRFDADKPHQFFLREHRRRFAESRNEELARMLGHGQQAAFYRLAFDVVLDISGFQFLIAEVATEDEGRRLVRALQNGSAFSRQGRQPGVNGTGGCDTRPPLD